MQELTRHELEEKLNALHAMIAGPGWKYMRATIELQQAAAKHRADTTPTGHDLAMHYARLRSFEELLSWPEREMKAIRQMLSDAEQSK